MGQTTIWMHASLYGFAQDLTPILDGAMVAQGDTIEWVGKTEDLANYPDATVIDCQHQVLTPGLIDCHTHLVFAGNRAQEFEARLQGESYQAIHAAGGGIQSTVRATRDVSIQDLFEQSRKRLKMMVAQGVTTVEIKSGYGLDLVTEAKMLKVASQLERAFGIQVSKTFLGAHTLAPEFKSTADYIDYIIDEMLPSLTEQKLVDAVDIFTETIGFSLEDAKRLFSAARNLNLPIKCHADQLSHMGASELAASFCALSVDHLEHTQSADMKAMQANGTVAVLLPGAYYFLNETRKPPVEMFRQHQIPMAVATDCNPGTSPCTSLLLMLNMACTLFGLTPEEALLGTTVHAAKALGLKDVGQLKPGFKANCVLWDIEHPRDLVYQFGSNPVRAVYSKGNLIHESKN